MNSVPGYPGPPKWVKRGVVVVIAAVALLLLLLVVGSGDHGPWRHLGADGDAPQAPVEESR